MKSPEENENIEDQENAQDPKDDIETVTSKNDNMDPVPDDEQLQKKKT